MIGDPSGKSQERVLLSPEQIDANVAGIRAQLERFLDFDARRAIAARIVNNADWLGDDRSARRSCATSASTSPSTTCCRRSR